MGTPEGANPDTGSYWPSQARKRRRFLIMMGRAISAGMTWRTAPALFTQERRGQAPCLS